MVTPDGIKKGLEYLSITDVAQKVEAAKRGLPYAYAEDIASDALAYIRELEAKMPKWISVKDRLPEKKQRVMVYTTQGAYRLGAFSFVGKEGAVWFKCDKSCISCTHWMPLPKQPEEQEGANMNANEH